MLALRLDALPALLAQIREANPGSIVHIQVDKDGAFERAFLMLNACVEAALHIGRNVGGSDFGHLQHSLFDGCEGSGCFKTGSGHEFPVWLMYSTGGENEEKWAYTAQHILKHQRGAELYDGLTEFSDRDKGKKGGFDSQFPGVIAVDCAGHILDNVRKVCRTHKEHFANAEFWRLQGSESVGACEKQLRYWETKYPHCYAYLIGIPAETWIWFKQVENGSSTYRERTSNLAEHDQAVQSRKGTGMRALDPMMYFGEGVKRMCGALSKEAARMRESKAAGSKLVPHALQLMRVNEALSTSRVAVGGPNVFIVSVATGAGVVQRVLNWGDRDCTCGKWQDENFPCPDAFAAGRSKGLPGLDVVMHGAEGGYFVTDFLETLNYKLVAPPTDAELKLQASADAEGASDNGPGIATYLCEKPTRKRASHAGALGGLEVGAVGAPPPKKRQNKHGNSKYGRYREGKKSGYAGRGSRGENTRGRTRVATSVATVELGNAKAHLLCRKCKAAGRIGKQYLGHRGICPYEQNIIVVASSDEEELDEEKELDEEENADENDILGILEDVQADDDFILEDIDEVQGVSPENDAGNDGALQGAGDVEMFVEEGVEEGVAGQGAAGAEDLSGVVVEAAASAGPALRRRPPPAQAAAATHDDTAAASAGPALRRRPPPARAVRSSSRNITLKMLQDGYLNQ